MKLYPRDASWWPRSKKGGSRRGVYHVPSDDEACLAACSRRIMIDDDQGMDLLEVPLSLVCKTCLRHHSAAALPELRVLLVRAHRALGAAHGRRGLGPADKAGRRVLELQAVVDAIEGGRP